MLKTTLFGVKVSSPIRVCCCYWSKPKLWAFVFNSLKPFFGHFFLLNPPQLMLRLISPHLIIFGLLPASARAQLWACFYFSPHPAFVGFGGRVGWGGVGGVLLLTHAHIWDLPHVWPLATLPLIWLETLYLLAFIIDFWLGVIYWI